MAKVQRLTYFKSHLEDKPGTLHAVAKELKGKNLGLIGLWGYETGQGQGDLYVIAKNPKKFRKAWEGSGKSFEEGTAFFLRGTDKTGALVKSLGALAEAGVNIVAIDALGVGGRFGSCVWVAPEDVEKAGRALGAK